MDSESGTFSEATVTFFRESAKDLSILLPRGSVTLFECYFRELLSWNEKVNLTQITEERKVIINHFIDSLVPERFISLGATMADIGSGAGFPGIPLKIVRPDLVVTLLESSFKKSIFLRHAIRALGLGDITVRNERAEELAAHGAKYQVCIGRAVSPLPSFVRTAHCLVEPGGSIIAMRGRHFEKELDAVREMLPELNLSVQEVEPVSLPFTRAERAIIVLGFCP